MKKILSVLIWVLAVNFLAVAGGVGYLFQSGSLDKEKAFQIKEIVFPPPATQPAASQPAEATDDQVSAINRTGLEQLLATKSGMNPAEQIAAIQGHFDTQMAELDRKHRELLYLQGQITAAREAAAKEREALVNEQKKLQQQQQQQVAEATDKGFQDSLQLYRTMPAKQAKEVFMMLDDATIIRYLQAMEPREAGKILKEFKTPDEVTRVQRIMEQMRQAEASTKG